MSSYLLSNRRRSLAHTIRINKRIIERRTSAVAKEYQRQFRALAWIDWMQQELRGGNHEQS